MSYERTLHKRLYVLNIKKIWTLAVLKDLEQPTNQLQM
jgi:hypothetical protein